MLQHQGQKYDKRWQIFASILSGIQIVATLVAGIVFESFFKAHALFALPEAYPMYLVGLISFFVASFIAYWWHRSIHKFDILWRVFHQLHHSPSRIESLTSFYMHPFDGVAATFINALSSFLIFGASTTAAAWALLYAGLNNLFIHIDLKTPHWTGLILQRPEMHRVHHKRNFHSHNYGLPIWDLMFGTWENPIERVEHCGFDKENEYKIKDMLFFKKIE